MEGNIRNLRVGDILKEYGYVTEEQISEAVAYQKENRGIRIGDALISLGYIQENQLLQALADRLDIKVIDLTNMNVDLGAVEKIPRALAVKYEILALSEGDGHLTVALNDPMNFYGIEDVRQITGMLLNICLCGKKELAQAIQYFYSELEAREAAKKANQSTLAQEIEEIADVTEDGDETPVIQLLNRLIGRAYATNASDIHVEPFEKNTVVRMRVDGAIVEYVTLQKTLHAPLIARIKIMGNMDIAERRIPQDGHFRARVEDEYVNIRVSIIPTVFGEKAVLRLLANNSRVDYPTTFGMEQESYAKVKKMLQSPYGIIYFTGPTGSGKTTTLYMILEELSKRPVNIVTIEDPVEKNLPKINQTQVNNQAGLTFETGLRSLLRQDPDIIMVGETRDSQTATISVRSAITGHLVFSTLHTNNAASSVARLEDMGLQPYMVAGSLVGVIAQRLMRKVCPECAEEADATEEERLVLGPAVRKVKCAKGCASCNYTGYRGRIAIHEILQVDKKVRRMILDRASSEEIMEYAIEHQGMRTLRERAVEMVNRGITTMEELVRVSYDE